MIAVAALLWSGACVKTVTTSLSTKVPPPSYVRPTRSAADCIPLVKGGDADAYALTTLSYHDSRHQNPVPKEIFIPDLSNLPPWTGPAGNAVATLRVNENGLVMSDSVRITGVSEGEFAKRLRASVRRGSYWPAVRLGCAVPAWYSMTFPTPNAP
ncbi:MAG: hypothetical protein M3Y64_07395 [Gemmatimonadota bacterium]|nr:hypothetical protein [Gemmatimonadota bacterium]